MQISVIICCHNSADRLPDCLARVDSALVRLPDIESEVIVVNNASTDQTMACALNLFSRLHGSSYRLVEESVPGLMHARIAGIRAADGEVLCFIDDDNWVGYKYFPTVLRIFAEFPEVGYFGCSTRLPGDRKFPAGIDTFASVYAVGDLHSATGLLSRTQAVWGAGLAVRSSVLKSIFASGCQPLLLGRSGAVQLAGDDSELCHMIALAGWRGWYECVPLLEHAIDGQRMNIPKLETMYRGFGASDSVQSRYILLLKGQVKMAFAFFALWYMCKLFKNMCMCLYSRSKGRPDLKSRLLSIKYFEAAIFFAKNREVGLRMSQNLACIHSLAPPR